MVGGGEGKSGSEKKILFSGGKSCKKPKRELARPGHAPPCTVERKPWDQTRSGRQAPLPRWTFHCSLEFSVWSSSRRPNI